MNANDIDLSNPYENIDMNVKELSGGNLGLEEVSFIRYFTNQRTFGIQKDDARALANKFRYVADKRRASVIKTERVRNLDMFVDWTKFSEAVEQLGIFS